MTNNRGVFRRKRIENALDNILSYSLTVVSATMGYGKSTSVREFLNNRKVNAIWVSANNSQGVEALFWSKLCKGVGKFHPETGEKLSELGFPFNLDQINQIIDYISEFKTEQKTILVIDDYHLIEHNELIGTLIEMIVQEEIPNLHIALLTRTRPNFKYLNLLSKGLCYYVDSAFLAFTADEIREYFNFMGFDSLMQTELERIESDTKGWISAIYLIMLGMTEGLNTEINANINQLIEENLFNQLEPQTQEALLSLSIFDGFTVDQAAVVLENKSIRQTVNELTNKNAFIECDPLTGEYKLHKVLRDYLKIKLESSSIDLKAIYRRAGKWCVESGDYVTAFDYYHRAGNIEELLIFLSKIDKVDISVLGNGKMCSVCNELPQYLCIKYPILFLQIALNFIFGNEKSMVDQGLNIVALISDFYGMTEGFPTSFCDKIFAELEIIQAILAFNDIDLMLRHLQKAGELFHGGMSSLIFRHSEFTFGLPGFLYSYYREPGKLKETVDRIVEAHTPLFFDGCGYGCEYLAFAEYALQTGNVVQAEFYIQKTIYKARSKMQISIELCACFTLMRLYLLKGEIPEAKQLLRDTRNMLTRLKTKLTDQSNIIYNKTMDLCEGYFYSCLEQLESIPVWLRAGDFTTSVFLFQSMAYPYLLHGKVALLSEEWVKLEAMSENFQDVNVYHNQLGRLHGYVCESVAKYHLYGKESGVEALLPALREAQADGVIMPFVENAEFLLPMLETRSVKEELDPGYYNKLMNFCRIYQGNLKAEAKSASVLTDRETEVLKLLAEGMTQKEIANLLVLSTSTVKRHLENIYQKFDVNNKISAINRGKELKVI